MLPMWPRIVGVELEDFRGVIARYTFTLVMKTFRSQAEAARKTKVPQPNISAWSDGSRFPTWGELLKLHNAKVLSLNVMFAEIADEIAIAVTHAARTPVAVAVGSDVLPGRVQEKPQAKAPSPAGALKRRSSRAELRADLDPPRRTK